MEKVITHMAQQIGKRITPGWAKDNELLQRVKELGKNEKWNFKSVTAEDFIKTMTALGELVVDIEKEKDKIANHTPQDVLYDRVAYRTSDFLKCIHTMESEAQQKRILSQRSSLMSQAISGMSSTWQTTMLFADSSQITSFPGMEREYISPKHRMMAEMTAINERRAANVSSDVLEMLNIIQQAKSELYRFNDNAISLLEERFPNCDISPIVVSEENEKRYTPNLAISHTGRVTREHEEAYAAVIKSMDNVLKYGLPSEGTIGKFMEKLLSNRAEIRSNNEQLIKDLLSKEMDIETIEDFVIPSLRLRSFELEMNSAIETVGLFDIGFTGIESSKTGPHVVYRDAIRQIEQMIKETREREAKMMPEIKMSINRGNDDVYTISISKAHGQKTEIKFNVGDSQHKKVTEKGYREKQRVFSLGKLSQELREEKKIYTAKIYGQREEIATKTHSKERQDEKIKIIKENVYGEISLATTRATKSHGKVAARMQLKADAAKIDRIFNRSFREGRKTKEQKIIGARTHIGGGSITASAPTRDSLGTPKISAEAHPIKADVNYKEVTASFSTGPKLSVGIQLSPEDIAKNAAKALIDEMAKGSSANFARVIDDTMEMIKNAGPSGSMNWGRIDISAAAMTLLTTKVDINQNEETQEQVAEIDVTTPLIDDIQQDINTGSKYFEQLQEMAGAWDESQQQSNQAHYAQPISTPNPVYDEFEQENESQEQDFNFERL